MRTAFRHRRILMTCDAVGGVWRYAVDLAGALKERGTDVVLAVLGPPPTLEQRREAQAVATLVDVDLPLDWMVDDPDALAAVPARLAVSKIRGTAQHRRAQREGARVGAEGKHRSHSPSAKKASPQGASS